MRYIKKFLQFDPLFEGILLEKVLIFGDKFKDVLNKMSHHYAKTLLQLNSQDILADNENSFIEINTKPGMVSWLPSNREVDFQTKKELSDEEKWNTNKRQDVAISRIVKSTFSKKNINVVDSELEKFVNEYKGIQNPSNFKLVKGDSIVFYYNQDQYDMSEYDEETRASLYKSCMRFDFCNVFLDVYKKNTDVSLCVLLNDNGEVQGRAIVWYGATIDDNKEVYMDRIYAISDEVTDKFKKYAHQNGWWCKIKQGIDNHEISNGVQKKEYPSIKVEIYPTVNWENVKKPYMDTLKFFSYNLVQGKYSPFLFNEALATSNNYKHKWDGVDGYHHTNSYYVDPLKEIKMLAENTGLDFETLLKSTPVKVHTVPELWKFNHEGAKNILVFNNMDTKLQHHFRTLSIDEIVELGHKFLKSIEIEKFLSYIPLSIIADKHRTDIMIDILENTDKYLTVFSVNLMKDYIQRALIIPIMGDEIQKNFVNVRDVLVALKPRTVGKILNDEYSIGLNLDDGDALINDYVTKFKENDKNKYILTELIENNKDNNSNVRDFCYDYIYIILRAKTVRQMYDTYIGESRQRKMNFINDNYDELVSSVNIIYIIKEVLKINNDEIYNTFMEFVASKTSLLTDKIINLNTEEVKTLRMKYTKDIWKNTYPNLDVTAEFRGRKLCYKVEGV